MGIITETLVYCDRFISFHPFYDLYEYDSCTFAFVPHDFAGYPLLRYLKAISLFETVMCHQNISANNRIYLKMIVFVQTIVKIWVNSSHKLRKD